MMQFLDRIIAVTFFCLGRHPFKTIPMHALETQNLTYRYTTGEVVLDNLNMKVREGSIYGFLGPNGAGKTTTLRLVLGLLKIQQGDVNLFGQSLQANRKTLLSKIGSLIETPSLYAHLTATENLEVLRIIYRCPKERISYVLELVGLANTGNKRVGQFSLGMKQRLSIAASLLHSPQLIILDEPTNGLDPNGIIELRELLKGLNKREGLTIVVSSHLLPEVDRLADELGIIHKGKMKFQGSIEELRNAQNTTVTLETSSPEQCVKLALKAGFTSRLSSGKAVIESMHKLQIPDFNRKLVNEGIDVFEIKQSRFDLEEMFIDIIK